MKKKTKKDSKKSSKKASKKGRAAPKRANVGIARGGRGSKGGKSKYRSINAPATNYEAEGGGGGGR